MKYYISCQRNPKPIRALYVGTYSDHVYQLSFDIRTGQAGRKVSVPALANPSWLAFSPAGPYMYAVGEREHGCTLSAYSISPSGIGGAPTPPRLINQREYQGGALCHIAISPDGRTLVGAFYASGEVFSAALTRDGAVGEELTRFRHTKPTNATGRQTSSHAHCAEFSRDGAHVLCCDLGDDAIYVYRFDAHTGALLPDPVVNRVPQGEGPRHVALSRDGTRAYVVTELGNKLLTYDFDIASGKMTMVGSVSTLAPGFSGESYVAEVVLFPGANTGADAKFAYVSNRGEDTVAVFDLSGELPRYHAAFPSGGEWPRHFIITPDGAFVLAANQNSGNVLVYKRDRADGMVYDIVSELSVDSPVWLGIY